MPFGGTGELAHIGRHEPGADLGAASSRWALSDEPRVYLGCALAFADPSSIRVPPGARQFHAARTCLLRFVEVDTPPYQFIDGTGFHAM